MTLIDRIQRLMETDSESREKQSIHLHLAYDKADKKGKNAIDDAMIALCGWSMTSLLNDPTLGTE